MLFLADGCTLATAGAMDGVVKLWDVRHLRSPLGSLACAPPQPSAQAGSPVLAPPPLRRLGAGSKQRQQPTRQPQGQRNQLQASCWMDLTCPSASTRPHGVTCLALSPAGEERLKGVTWRRGCGHCGGLVAFAARML